MDRGDHRHKVIAEIAKLGAEVWTIFRNYRKDRDKEKEDKIRKMEREIEELKKKLKGTE